MPNGGLSGAGVRDAPVNLVNQLRDKMRNPPLFREWRQQRFELPDVLDACSGVLHAANTSTGERNKVVASQADG